MDTLTKYSNSKESLDILYTIIIYDKKRDEIIDEISDLINKSKNITNPIKRGKVSERLTLLKNFMNDNFDENSVIHGIFLIDAKINYIELLKNHLETCREYKMRNFFIKNDTVFHIEYLIDFFTNFDFIYHLRMTKNDGILIKMNKYKEKELSTHKNINEKLLQELSESKDNIYVSGIKMSIDNKKIICIPEQKSRDDIWNLFMLEKMKKNHVELEKRIRDISNPKMMDLYVFGKLKFEIKESMENYLLKELFIEEEKLEKLKTFVSEELFNFKIFPIKVIEQGDVADNFIKNFNGIMGIKYY